MEQASASSCQNLLNAQELTDFQHKKALSLSLALTWWDSLKSCMTTQVPLPPNQTIDLQQWKDAISWIKKQSGRTSGRISDMYVNQTSGKLIDNMDNKEEKKSFRKLLKDVELLGSSQMNWKERKKIEDQNVVSLGGKPKRNCKMPIILGGNIMKKRQEKEQKLLQEGVIGQIPRKYTSKRQINRPEDQVLKISQGNFRNGVLNVKHILRKNEAASRVEIHNHGAGKEKKRGKMKQQKSRKRRHRS